MATLPHEIKRLVYDFADLETIKALRLVSQSWATVGIELLFLPTFVIKSYAIDLQRLVDIGSIARISFQAAKTIRTLEFRDNQYDPSMLRRIFCSRHVQVSQYWAVDFVGSEVEQESLNEIDAVITQRKLDDRILSDNAENFLIKAFRNVPFVDTIHFSFGNPFKHPMIRKVWEEFEYETYDPRHESRSVELSTVLTAIHRSGLTIQRFRHERFLPHRQLANSFGTLTSLKSLNFGILDLNNIYPRPLIFDAELDRCPGLQDLLLANSRIEDLSIHFQTLALPTLNLFQSIQPGYLRNVTFVSLTFRGPDLLSFFSTNAATLKRAKLQSIELSEPGDTWQGVLTDIRNNPDINLEKFQVSGVTKSSTETWVFWPIYDADWNDRPDDEQFLGGYNNDGTNKLTKVIERFVMGKEEWPTETMLLSDMPSLRTA